MSAVAEDEEEARMMAAALSVVERNIGTMVKVPIVAAIICCAAYSVDGASFWRSLLFGCLAGALLIFRTWRRTLEFIALPIFIITGFALTSDGARQFLAALFYSLTR